MVDPSKFIKKIMRDVPRGNPNKHLWQQQVPKARWQDLQAILDSEELTYNPKNPQGKILFGALGNKLIGIRDDRHILTIAGSRAGKTITVDANLFFYDGSAVVLDPKGGSAMKTALARAHMGQKIYIIDPFNIVKGKAAQFKTTFNFLARLSLDNPNAIEDTVDIIDALIKTSGNKKDPHWDEAAGEFLTGLCLHVRFSKKVNDEDRHLATVRKLAMKAIQPTSAEDETPKLQNHMLDTAQYLHEKGYEDIAATITDSTTSFYEKSENEGSSVLSTLRRHIKFLIFPAMKKVAAKNSFDLKDLKQSPKGVTLYLVLPATRTGMCSRFYRLFLNALIADMERVPKKPKHPILMVLDEFPVLGYMNQIENAAGQMASFGVKLWVILQDWGQGKALYKDRFESFAANAGVFQAFGNVDVTTTAYISRRLGKTPVTMHHQKEIAADLREKGITGKEEITNNFDLLAADEIALLFARSDPLKRQLIIHAGFHPYIIQRVEHFKPNDPIGKFIH